MLMRKQEVASLMADGVAELIAEGFTLSPMELTGSYSGVEGQHVVFAKGMERAILWVERKGGWNELEQMVVRIARFELKDKFDLAYQLQWPDDWAEHTWREAVAYRLSYGKYTDDMELALEAREKRGERSVNLDRGDELELPRTVEMTKRLICIVRKLDGFKTVPADNIRASKTASNRWEFVNIKSGRRVMVG